MCALNLLQEKLKKCNRKKLQKQFNLENLFATFELHAACLVLLWDAAKVRSREW